MWRVGGRGWQGGWGATRPAPPSVNQHGPVFLPHPDQLANALQAKPRCAQGFAPLGIRKPFRLQLGGKLFRPQIQGFDPPKKAALFPSVNLPPLARQMADILQDMIGVPTQLPALVRLNGG